MGLEEPHTLKYLLSKALNYVIYKEKLMAKRGGRGAVNFKLNRTPE